MTRRGLLLINLGTPEAPTPPKVRDYLEEFLMDPYVVDVPAAFRWLLVHGVILRKRPAQSAEAYRKIWTDRGSPLLFHHLDLADKVQARLESAEPGRWRVVPAMRYGQPSIDSAIERLHAEGIREVTVFPLYPQYSLAATESSVVKTREEATAIAPAMTLEFLPAFYEDDAFIGAFVQVARESLKDFDFDHLLFSFHGLPERQIKKTDRSGSHCLTSAGCCERISDANRDCYRAQCFATARALAKGLELPESKYTVCFQSRLGRTPWIKPFTDVLYEELPKHGVRKLAVMSPAFVADCLETLEEIQIRGKQAFIALGGEDLRLIPSLNASDVWAEGVSRMVRRKPGAPEVRQ